MRDAVGGHPIVAERLAARGVVTAADAMQFIHPERYQPAAVEELPGVDDAIERLMLARSKDEKVCVWGDFDVDGQTSTALLVDVLRRLGFHVNYHIPNRKRESHGVNIAFLEGIIAEGTSLVVTCDTGIAASEAVSYAANKGVDFVITDHHDLPDRLPQAAALVNPKFLPTDHKLHELPGVGVAYLVAQHLCNKLDPGLDMSLTLDLVALGIVADLALQVHDVRYLLQLGLRQIRESERAGLKALLSVCDLEQEYVTEEQIGFIIAPRMNALGRLADANPAVEFLLSGEIEAAMHFARQLESLNAQRKQLSDAVYASAKRMLAGSRKLLEFSAIVLEGERWPAGVVGLVAGRLVEEYQKPVILLSLSPDGLARGSARSIEGVDISEVIASQSELLEGFGGHPMAAGLSMRQDHIKTFRRAVDKYIKQHYPHPFDEFVLRIDAYLTIDALDLALVADLERLAPFGPGNPPLMLATKDLSVIGSRAIGKNEDHLLVRVKNSMGNEHEIIWWNGSSRDLPAGRFDLAYKARTSYYRGEKSVQIEWIADRSHVTPPIVYKQSKVRVIDHRFHSNPRDVLHDIKLLDMAIWAEGRLDLGRKTFNRYDIEPCNELVIWTAPPDPGTFRTTLHKVNPEIIHVFLIVPEPGSPSEFLRMLIGMSKYSLEKREGIFAVREAAVALAQTETAVVLGLELLAGLKIIDCSEQPGDLFSIQGVNLGGTVNLSGDAELQRVLTETASFRAYTRKVDQAWFSNLLH